MATAESVKVMNNDKDHIPRNVSFNHGKIIVNNVPHQKKIYPHYDQQHIEYYLSGSVDYILSAITEYMEENGLSEFDFKDYIHYPEIEQKLHED